VTLLPVDPDASADRIRAAVRAAFGVDVPVIVSDSFGRPWRWGIVDVAIGVSGMLPLDDMRGKPDADGRIMRSTVRATADEIATAAELALGKTAGGRRRSSAAQTHPRRGRIADALMPREFDLFPVTGRTGRRGLGRSARGAASPRRIRSTSGSDTRSAPARPRRPDDPLRPRRRVARPAHRGRSGEPAHLDRPGREGGPSRGLGSRRELAIEAVPGLAGLLDDPPRWLGITLSSASCSAVSPACGCRGRASCCRR
jgi:hypothetical protein